MLDKPALSSHRSQTT